MIPLLCERCKLVFPQHLPACPACAWDKRPIERPAKKPRKSPFKLPPYRGFYPLTREAMYAAGEGANCAAVMRMFGRKP
jgi:hypothetical protein